MVDHSCESNLIKEDSWTIPRSTQAQEEDDVRMAKVEHYKCSVCGKRVQKVVSLKSTKIPSIFKKKK
jgi:transposase-like protein